MMKIELTDQEIVSLRNVLLYYRAGFYVDDAEHKMATDLLHKIRSSNR